MMILLTNNNGYLIIETFAKPVKCHSERSEESFFYFMGYQHYKIFRFTQNDS